MTRLALTLLLLSGVLWVVSTRAMEPEHAVARTTMPDGTVVVTEHSVLAGPAAGHRQSVLSLLGGRGRGKALTDESDPRVQALQALVLTAQAATPVPRLPAETPARCREHESVIIDAARQNGLEPEQVLAMLIIESGCLAGARSESNARGMAQVMPDTAVEIRQNTGLPCDTQPFDPETSIRCGAWYLGRQFKTFGTFELAMTAYNAGPGGAQAFLAGRGLTNQTHRYRYWAGIYAGPGRLNVDRMQEWCRAAPSLRPPDCLSISTGSER